MSDTNGTLSVGERLNRIEEGFESLRKKVNWQTVAIVGLGIVIGAVKVVELVLAGA